MQNLEAMPEKDEATKVETHFIIHSIQLVRSDGWVIRFLI